MSLRSALVRIPLEIGTPTFPFFDLDLSIEREGGPLRLTLSGREGVKEFIRSEFEPWFLALRKDR